MHKNLIIKFQSENVTKTFSGSRDIFVPSPTRKRVKSGSHNEDGSVSSHYIKYYFNDKLYEKYQTRI